MITLSGYQEEAVKTAIFDERYRLMYPVLGLAGEVGEVANKVKKIFRDYDGDICDIHRTELEGELGDVLWYLAVVAHDLDLDLGKIAQHNLDKLRSRQERGTLGGKGDNR